MAKVEDYPDCLSDATGAKAAEAALRESEA
jgi:hypothetical protein